jgi:hypothetical protein
MRTEALKKAQIKYREANKDKLNIYAREYCKNTYKEKRQDKKKEYYELNKDKIKEKMAIKNFELSVFSGFRRMMKDEYR